MKLPSALNPLGVDFDRFLYAQVGDDHQGGMLSVVSALARVGVDPWEQAAILARLPVDSAVRALSALLARLPARSGRPLDPIPLATRLVSLLPRASALPGLRPAVALRTVNINVTSGWFVKLLFLGCLLLLVIAAHLIGQSAPTVTAPVVTPAPPVSRSR